METFATWYVFDVCKMANDKRKQAWVAIAYTKQVDHLTHISRDQFRQPFSFM